MRFKVPQFIEVEDKIFGPLSFRQFVYLVGGGGLGFVLWRLLPWFFAWILIFPVIIFSVALAFYKPNNRPFIDILEAAMRYTFGKKLYLWKHKTKKQLQKKPNDEIKPALEVPHLSQSKLKDIAWELDIQESIYSKETTPR